MNTITMGCSRLVLGAGGAVAGYYCAAAAFETGQTMIQSAAFAAVAVASWFMLPMAAVASRAGERHVALSLRFGWAIAFFLVLYNAISYTALHKTEAVGGRANLAAAHDRAEADRRNIEEQLAQARSNPRWQSTAGCTNATAERSREFCGKVSELQQRLDAAARVLDQGRPGSVDPIAETVAWVISGDPRKIARAEPVFKAIILEMLATILFAGAMWSRKAEPQPEPEPQAPVALQPVVIKTQKPARKAKPQRLPPPRPGIEWRQSPQARGALTRKAANDHAKIMT